MPISWVDDDEAMPAGSQTGLSVDRPSGVASGDLLLMLHGMLSASVVITAEPAGTTALDSASSGSNLSARVKSKPAGGGEPATYDWTLASAVKQGGWVGAYRGLDAAAPVAAVDMAARASGTSYTTPPVDVPVGGWLVYGVVSRHAPGAAGVATWSSNIVGEVRRANLATNQGSADITMAVWDSGGPLAAATGATRVITSTLTEGVAVVFAVALAPDVVPSPGGVEPRPGIPLT